MTVCRNLITDLIYWTISVGWTLCVGLSRVGAMGTQWNIINLVSSGGLVPTANVVSAYQILSNDKDIVYFVKLFFGDCHKISAIINRQRFGWRLDAARQQAVSSVNSGPEFRCFMTSVSHNELIWRRGRTTITCRWVRQKGCIFLWNRVLCLWTGQHRESPVTLVLYEVYMTETISIDYWN